MKKVISCIFILVLLTSTMAAFAQDDYDYSLIELEEGISIYGGHFFNDGWMPIYSMESDNPWTYVHESGLVKQLHVNAHGFDFSEGLAPVVGEDGLGYINVEGDLVIPMKFSAEFKYGTVYAGRFVNGKALVNVGSESSAEWKNINKKGEFVEGEINLETLYSDTSGGYAGVDSVEILVAEGKTFEFVDFKNDIGVGNSNDRVYIIKRSKKAPVVVKEETSKIFSDVPLNTWYTEDVELAFDQGLIGGKGEGLFDPMGHLKISEIITLASRARAKHDQEEIPMSDQGQWYQSYVDYAVSKNIITESMFEDFNRSASRYDVARVIEKALPSEAYAVIDGNTNIVIPDVKATEEALNMTVYNLYHMGIFGGSGTDRVFNGDSNVSRAEAAIVVNRLLMADKRVEF